MSKFRIMADAVVDTESHANTLLTQAQNRYAGKDIFEVHSSQVVVGDENDSSTVHLLLDIRFNSQLDRDDLKAYIETEILNKAPQKNWVDSLKGNIHDCTHSDTIVKDCTTTNFEAWGK